MSDWQGRQCSTKEPIGIEEILRNLEDRLRDADDRGDRRSDRHECGGRLSGFITYGRDGRMLALIVRGHRPCPESAAAITDAQRAALFRTMLSYGGTCSFDGFRVTHRIDISWNGVWTGTTLVREVARDGARLVYRMGPAPFSADGRVSAIEVVWEKAA